MRYFFAHRKAMWRDNWTYGNWRQYVVQREPHTQCARLSELSLYLPLLGGAALALAIMGALQGVFMPATSIIGLILFVVPIVWTGMGYRLMKTVGPPNVDGNRVLPGEKAAMGFDEDHSVGDSKRSVKRSHRAEGRNWVD